MGFFTNSGVFVKTGQVRDVDYSVVKDRSTDDMVFGVFNAVATVRPTFLSFPKKCFDCEFVYNQRS